MQENNSLQRILLIVDPQNDFINGSLSVPQAEEAMEALSAYVEAHGGEYNHIFVTTDWHPANHCSFVGEGGQWPAHCVQGTEGAELYPALTKALAPFSPTLLRKGDTVDTEEYSIFKNSQSADTLHNYIIEKEIERIDLCGIAGDICVLDTYKDGIARYSKELFHILLPFCPSLDGGTAIGAVANP